MKRLLQFFMLAVLFLPLAVNAQLGSTYLFSTGVDNTQWYVLTADSTVLKVGSNNDSYASPVTDLGFTFHFAGEDYTQFSVNSDGTVRLGSTAVTTSYYNAPFGGTNGDFNNPKICGLGVATAIWSAPPRPRLPTTSPTRFSVPKARMCWSLRSPQGRTTPTPAATTTTGIENWLLNSISLYPNPAKEYIDVRVDGLHVTGMEVYDVYGKLINTVSVVDNPTRINVSCLASGMYFVRVTTEQGVVTKSFVKK